MQYHPSPYINLVDLADLASRCQRPAIDHRILEKRMPQRRSGANFVLFEPGTEPSADHGCTGSGWIVTGSDGKDAGSTFGCVLHGNHTMTTRTTQTVVHFLSPFRLPGFDAPRPAGDYLVDRDDESIEIASHLAWRRVATFIHLPAISTASATRQMVPVDPSDLEAALEKDQK